MGKRTSDLDLNCSLNEGKYKVIYDKSFTDYQNWEFELKNDLFIEFSADKEIEHKLDWISANRFRIKSLEEQTDSLTDIQKQLNSLGIPFYNLSKCKADTLNFEYMHNDHITINTGKLIKTE
jgi:hypothetical protein